MENQPLAERLRPKNLDEYIGQQHFNNLIELAKEYFGVQPSGVESLPKSGSQRRYYRLFVNGKSFIGVYNDNLNENQLFINFTLHFGAKKLHVPQIFAISKDGLSYIQEDLGRSMLLDFALNKDNTGGLTEEVMHLYRQALVELLRFQFLGGTSRLRLIRPGVDAAELIDVGVAQLGQCGGGCLTAVSAAAVNQHRGVLLGNHLGSSILINGANW